MTSFVSSSFSVIGSAATIGSFLFHLDKNKRAQHLFQFIFFLAIADFFASLSLAGSVVLWWISKDAYNMPVCITLRAFPQFFFVSSFIWTSIIAFHLFRATQQQATGKSTYIGYHVAAWGIPGILLSILLGSNNINRAQDAFWCHPTIAFEWLFWFLPMLLSVLCNLLFYILIIRNYRKKKTQRSRVILKLSLFLLAFITCWIWDIIEHVRILVAPDCKLFFLWFLQDLFTPSQGLLNFMVYAVTSKMIYNSGQSFAGDKVTERTRLRSDDSSSINE